MTLTKPVWRAEPPTTTPTGDLSGGRVGVLTWNVQHASAVRATSQADWLATRPEADIVVLTEVAGGAGGQRLAGALAHHGYMTRLPDGDGRDYRVLIAGRVGHLASVDHVGSSYLPHRLAAVTIILPGGSRLGVVGLYVPSRGPRERRNVAKRAFQNSVTTLLPTWASAFGPGVPVIVAGDLNVVEPGHQPHHAVFGTWEYDFYHAFGTAGYTDAFRQRNPETADHSWYGRADRGYRIDHLFSTGLHAEAITDCRYLHHPHTFGLSDHAALAASFCLSTPPT